VPAFAPGPDATEESRSGIGWWRVLSDRCSRTRPLAIAVLGGSLASAAAGVVMLALRSSLQVRSLPERLLEWVLLFVPLDVFEAGILRLGTDAKRYALGLATLVLLLTFAALAAGALHRRWTSRQLLALGLAVWLILMLAVLPLTSAGVFGTELVGGTWGVVLGYLAACLTYSSVLAAARCWLDATSICNDRSSALAERRLALAQLGGAAASLVATYALSVGNPGSEVVSVTLRDPQEPVPSGGLEPPSSHPEGPSGGSPRAAAEQSPTLTATAAAVPTRELFEPRPLRSLKRDKDGAVLPSGRRKGELTDLITSNDDFYIVTKNAAGDPVLRFQDWRLRMDGEVERAIDLDYASLRALPAVETTKTLECISNFAARCELAPFGCDLISTARWRGVRLSDLLRLAGGAKTVAAYLAVLSADEYTSALPLDTALDPDTLLVYEMNGEVLPREHGYPARLLVPGRYGLKDAKWVVGLRLMTREVVDWYGQRNWTRDAIVHTMTRIDVPTPDLTVPAGESNIAGIAYAGNRGIVRVEFSADGGRTWQQAGFIEPALGRDTWVRWLGRFRIAAGASVTLISRSTDGSPEVQPGDFSLPQPDGSTGWPSVQAHAAD
jgi:DMSO/TMAO reductase YedYZ molybdopterin-dependent catalytic subunit